MPCCSAGARPRLILGGEKNVTNGATGDIQMATQLARSMVMEWGMSDKLGRVRYNGNEQEVFLGHSVTQTTEHFRTRRRSSSMRKSASSSRRRAARRATS